MPSCKKFWSIADYNKLSSADKEIVKQEIVRTLVAFQKSAFYVFEDRDPELRDFLLNCRCESMFNENCLQWASSNIVIFCLFTGMDTNMKRSCEVENQHTKNRFRSQITECSTNGLGNDIDPEKAEQYLESRHGNRRVMFAEDFNEDDSQITKV